MKVLTLFLTLFAPLAAAQKLYRVMPVSDSINFVLQLALPATLRDEMKDCEAFLRSIEMLPVL